MKLLTPTLMLNTVTTVPSTADIPDTLTTVHYTNHKGTASPNTTANSTQPIQHLPYPHASTPTVQARTHATHARTPARNPRTHAHRHASVLPAHSFSQPIFHIRTQALRTTTMSPRLSPNLITSSITLSLRSFHIHCTYFFRTKNTFIFTFPSLIVIYNRSFHSLKMKHFPDVHLSLRKRADGHRRRTRST